MSSANVPKFSSLPLDKKGPYHNAWNLYGKDDELGTLNRLTEDRVLEAAKEIKTGTRISLNWPLDAQADLVFFGRQAFHKKLYQKPPRIINDDVWTFNTQSSSQWDGFRHFAYQKEERFYNGLTLDEIHGRNGVPQTKRSGIDAWSRQGIVGRGILLDFHEWRLKNNVAYSPFGDDTISADQLRQVAKDQGTDIRFGDILIVRSGYMHEYNKRSRDEVIAYRGQEKVSFSGVEQSESMMEFIFDNFSACAGDHPAWECWPSKQSYYLHEVMLAGWGMPIGELFDLEKLGAHCKATGRYSFFVSSEPVNVPGGVASPPNILAIF